MQAVSKSPRFSFIFDFDSTLVAIESLDELIALSLKENLTGRQAERKLKKIRSITDQGMNGEIDFQTSVQSRLRPANVQRCHLSDLCRTITETITPGIATVVREMQTRNFPVFIVSGALIDCILPVAKKLAIPQENIFANRPLFDSKGKLTGIEPGPLASGNGKTKCIGMLRTLGLLPGETVMVGDGISDLEPLRAGIIDRFFGAGFHRNRTLVEREAEKFFTSAADLHRHLLTMFKP